MHARSQENTFLLLTIIEITNNQLITIITGYCLAKDLALQQVFALGIQFDLFQKVLKTRVGVRI
jgi:hypothetical protein